MNPLDQLRRALPDLTKAEAKVANAILKEPQLAYGSSLSALAQASGSSNSAVIRMCQKLGYDGFSEFRFSFSRAMLSRESGNRDVPGDSDADQLLEVYGSYISQIPQFISDDQFNRLAHVIASANRIDIWGVNRTAESAQQLSNRLTRLGVYNKWTSDPIVMSDDASILGEGDACILLTMAGRGIATAAEMMDTLRGRGAEVYLITMDRRSGLGAHAGEALYLPWISRDPSVNFYEDQVIVFMFIEILMVKVSRVLGRVPRD